MTIRTYPSRVGLAARLGHPLVLALASAFVAVMVMRGVPQGLYSDPAWQLKATYQYTHDASTSWLTLEQPRTDDLSRDGGQWLSWWAPGIAAVALPFLRRGAPVGTVVRYAAAICFVIGVVGWIRWFQLFDLEPRILLPLAILFPWIRYATNTMFLYSAESFVFAIAPWSLLVAWMIAERWAKGRSVGVTLALAAGLALGAGYIFKYSIVLAGAGVCAYLAVLNMRTWIRPIAHLSPQSPTSPESKRFQRWTSVLELAALGLGFLIPIAGITALNKAHQAAANLVTAGISPGLRWRSFAHAVANLPLMLADADALWQYVLFNPNRQWKVNEDVLLLIGVPAGLLLLWLLLDRKSLQGAGALAIAAASANVAALLGLWLTSSTVSFEARHVASGAFALLPLTLREGARRVNRRERLAGLLIVAGAVFMAAPLLYGVATVFAKRQRQGNGYAVSTQGLYNPLFAPRSVPACLEALNHGTDSVGVVWYLPEPISSLEIQSRAIIVAADFTDTNDLRRIHYSTSTPLRVHALFPPTFEANGKAKIIRGSFLGASHWRHEEFPECAYTKWTADLIPEPQPAGKLSSTITDTSAREIHPGRLGEESR